MQLTRLSSIALLTLTLAGAARLSAAGDDSLDFLAGEWDIFNATGRLTGTTKVEIQLPRAAMSEVRKGTDGRELKIWYFYSEDHRAWTSVFQGPGGEMRELVVRAIFTDGSVQMTGRFPSTDGTVSQSRFTYFKLPDGQVRRLLETSADDGRTWRTLVDAVYHRRLPGS